MTLFLCCSITLLLPKHSNSRYLLPVGTVNRSDSPFGCHKRRSISRLLLTSKFSRTSVSGETPHCLATADLSVLYSLLKVMSPLAAIFLDPSVVGPFSSSIVHREFVLCLLLRNESTSANTTIAALKTQFKDLIPQRLCVV